MGSGAEEFDIKAKIWLEKDGEPVFGLGRFLLLEKIEAFGSISAAAKELRYSYKITCIPRIFCTLQSIEA